MQPELALEFISPTGTATLARRVIQVLLGWELDAESRHKRECVRSAWCGSRICRCFWNYGFSRYEGTSSQVADRDRRLLVVTLHVAVSGPGARGEAQLGCLARVWPWSAGVPRPVVLSCLSFESMSFQALAGDSQVVALFLGERTCSSNSFVSSAVCCPYALRRCDWPWYSCLGSCWLVQACFLPRIGARAIATVGAPTSATDRYLGAWQLCARYGISWSHLPGEARAICRSICLLTQTWPGAHCCAVRPVNRTGTVLSLASQAALLLAWRVPSKLNLADAPTRPEKRTSEFRALIDRGFC